MKFLAILYTEGDENCRVFEGNACLYNAYRFAHKWLKDPEENTPSYKLPEHCRVEFHFVPDDFRFTTEQKYDLRQHGL